MIKKQLEQLAEPDYQKFTSSLIPNIPAQRILGVRVPILRKLAGSIAKGDWDAYLAQPSGGLFEEIMLRGMVIGRAKMSTEERMAWIADFIPLIDNWSICDVFCGELKFARKNPEIIWEFLQPYLQDSRPYFLRFGVVMLLDYYISEEYIARVLACLDSIISSDYYVKMAVAWAVSICFIKQSEVTMVFLKDNSLDNWTYNKALQKIIESRRIDDETRSRIRAMKRQ